jgi:Tfp pilus assembly pilus retraction ATPase PilT
MQTGGRLGMKTMSQSLAELVRSGRVRIDEAERAVADPTELRTLIRAA